MRLQEYGSCIQSWCSSLCLTRTSTWWNSSLQLVITSVCHIQWPLLFGLLRGSVSCNSVSCPLLIRQPSLLASLTADFLGSSLCQSALSWTHVLLLPTRCYHIPSLLCGFFWPLCKLVVLLSRLCDRLAAY